ncbi:hypothetical protein AsAng_0053250 [Aureispira anguillae]|uniref:Uncharacterized protein n=1 Tax=Aureispira anguillae TaxID=2864201 RepID=A0A916DWC9_9BACT|nr:hypothetical protein AsAng_0053250 [Aureispira anguillae]
MLEPSKKIGELDEVLNKSILFFEKIKKGCTLATLIQE